MAKKPDPIIPAPPAPSTPKETSERLHYALTATEEGIWDWNLETDSGYLSPRYFEMLGYRNNEFPGTGQAGSDRVHPKDKTDALARVVAVIREKKNSYESIYRMRHKDKRYRWMRSRAIVVRWDGHGVPVRMVGTHLDITEERVKDSALRRYKDNLEQEVEKQTRELRTANRQLETILNTSSDSIWVCDGRGTILSINKAGEELLNVNAQDLVGHNVSAFEKSGFIDQSVTRKVLATQKPVTMMQTVTRPQKQLLVTGTPVFDDMGQIDMVIVNERDLTHLNQLRDDLQEAQKASTRYKEELTQLNLSELRDQEIIAESKEMQQVIATAQKLAKRRVSPILITGESGTGKGLMVKFIHSKAHEKDHPFVQINCAALPETLLEAELFGYEKGAFTGASDQGKIGLFEMAKGGTLFLDELGEMSLPVQAKLLKCLEEKEIMRLGGIAPIKIDCTVICATNLNLSKQVQKQKFRQDLFFRLNTFTLRLPPLRRRPEDIFEMIIFFLNKYNKKYGLKRKISTQCLQQIQASSLPGNARELKNLLKKAVVMGESDILEDLVHPHMPIQEAPPELPPTGDFNFKDKIMAYEKELLNRALENHDTTRALARFLNLSQSSVVRKLKAHGLGKKLRRNARRR
ncbi:MAG: sigma 54-interacting transcriptional regulator [Desulfovibrionales bacterium]|nr:sigma 54-interacting transcriptional regulator [Desulfovibrionales bacterium]